MSGYHRLAWSSLARLSALSDGVFAIVLTLLVLELHVPLNESMHLQQPLWQVGALAAEGELWRGLVALTPHFVAYLMSFLTLGIFWNAQGSQLSQFTRSDRDLTWIHLAFLLVVSLLPFSTSLLSEFITYRLALLAYWFNLLLLGMTLLASWRYARRAGLLGGDARSSLHARRIISYQLLYAGAALLGVVSTYLSIALLVLLQLNSALSLRARLLGRS